MKRILIPLAIAAAFAVPTTAHADGPTVTASIDCQTFTVHVEGLRDGDRLVVEQGSNPPFGFVMGSGAYWQFTVTADGTADAVLESALNPWFTADVGVILADGTSVWPFHQLVDCQPPDLPPAVDPATPVVEIEPPVVASVVEVELWSNVRLAPPW